MKATVALANHRRGMYAAQTEGSGYVIFELLDPNRPEVTDALVAESFESMGDGEFTNLSQRRKISVYVQNVVNGLEEARKQCFL